MEPTAEQTTATDRDRVSRAMVIIIRVLYLLSIPIPIIPMVAGVIMALQTRKNAPPMWEAHMNDCLQQTINYVVLMMLGLPFLFLFLIGVVPITIAYMLLAYRTVRGLILALRWQPV